MENQNGLYLPERVLYSGEANQSPKIPRRNFLKLGLACVVGAGILGREAQAQQRTAAYSLFVCDSFREKPDFRLYTTDIVNKRVDEIANHILKNGFEFKGLQLGRNVEYYSGDAFHTVLFHYLSPVGTRLRFNIANNLTDESVVRSGEDWNFVAQRAIAGRPGRYSIVAERRLPNRDRFEKIGEINLRVKEKGILLDGTWRNF